MATDPVQIGVAVGQVGGLLVAVKWLVSALERKDAELREVRGGEVARAEKIVAAMTSVTAALETLTDRIDRAEERRRAVP